MTTNPGKGAVVVGYEGARHSEAALEWATRYAVIHHRPILLVHTADRWSIDETLAKVKERAPTVDVRVQMSTGNARDVLLDASQGAHLLVIGSRRRGALASLLLGSVSVSVSAHAPCPVAVVRPETDRARFGPFVGRVVVGVDGSEASMGALDFAFDLASTESKPLAILHAWAASGVYRDLMTYELRLDTSEEHELQVAESIAGYAEKYPDVLVSQHQDEEDPARALVAASEDADTLVVGCRGRNDAVSVIFGSVSRYVVEHAHCPTIVVRMKADHTAVRPD